MAVEEPDIELGTGFAFKVISRRIVAGPIRKGRKSGKVGRRGRRGRRRGRVRMALTSTVKGTFEPMYSKGSKLP
ncbi:uncharacterized protein N7473_002768 [Penicillium subrubescens]|jgi:hypothetical protein|uniref:uncharacterized protein n=1 Tax=Penicillium subrubescens TaxID=1316194 RepID=UPI002545752F|nr:uncharacterized protein N7473_002768 [Penicillium subrubescens]KAJ5905852.1 hypothetical protein N7473_002768 [Penicillium subrubescens]